MLVFIRESGIISVHFQGATPGVLVKTTFSNSASFPHTLIYKLANHRAFIDCLMLMRLQLSNSLDTGLASQFINTQSDLSRRQ